MPVCCLSVLPSKEPSIDVYSSLTPSFSPHKSPSENPFASPTNYPTIVSSFSSKPLSPVPTSSPLSSLSSGPSIQPLSSGVPTSANDPTQSDDYNNVFDSNPTLEPTSSSTLKSKQKADSATSTITSTTGGLVAVTVGTILAVLVCGIGIYLAWSSRRKIESTDENIKLGYDDNAIFGDKTTRTRPSAFENDSPFVNVNTGSSSETGAVDYVFSINDNTRSALVTYSSKLSVDLSNAQPEYNLKEFRDAPSLAGLGSTEVNDIFFSENPRRSKLS